MNAKYSLKLLATVCFSFSVCATNSYAQQGRVIVNPSPLESGDVQEPSQSTLMEPVDIEDQKLRRERALLDSIVVPEPGSSYFADEQAEDEPESASAPMPAPMIEDEASAMPADRPLAYPKNDVDEYERWATEQKTKYKKSRAVEPMVPIEVDEEPPPMPVDAEAPPMPSRPTHYSRKDRLSTAPEMTQQVEELGVDSVPSMQPMAAQIDWNALEGSSIRQVLQGWCSQADVRLIWQSENDFAVLNPFVMRSTFERAAQKLLDQYQDNHVRPVATLHVDPETNTKTLVVRVVEGQ